MAEKSIKNPYQETKSSNDELTALKDNIEDKIAELMDKEGVTSNKMNEQEMQEAMEKVFKMILEQVQALDNEQDLANLLTNLLNKKFAKLPPELMKKALNSIKLQAQAVGKFSQKISDSKQTTTSHGR